MPHVTVSLFLIKEGKIFLLKRKNSSYYDWFWWLPAWRLEDWEFITAWILREVKEEIWIDLNPEKLSKPMIVHHINSNRQVIRVYFMCKEFDQTPFNAEPEKCEEARWFDLEKLPENMVPIIPFLLKNFLNWERFLEIDFEDQL